MRKLLAVLLLLTLTGCSSSAQSAKEQVVRPVIESNQPEKPVPEKPYDSVEPASEPVKEDKSQVTIPTPELPKPAESDQPKPQPTPKPQTQQPKQIDLSGWIEYHSDDIKTLSKYLNEGLVIIQNDKYYASPELVKMLESSETVYENDVSDGGDFERGLDPDTEYEIVE
jgi:hypothetical protein